jgi:hypothetical protein
MSSNEWSTRPALSWSRGGVLAPAASGPASWLEPALLCGLALALRVVWLDAGLHFDELYHLLAADGWLEYGEPRIADGVYERGSMFTTLIAWCFALFGNSIEVARLPSMVFGTALVAVAFLWTRSVAGSLAAWATGLLLAVSTLAVELSYIVRFYTLQGLAVFVAAWCAWQLASGQGSTRQRVALTSAGIACGLLAITVHIVSLIHLAGVGLWFVAALSQRTWPWLGGKRRLQLLIAATVLATGVMLVSAIAQVGILEQLWQEYRWTPLWAAENQHKIYYYHVRLLELYPFLWALTPFAALAALTAWPRAATFCLTVFGSSLVLLSFGGMKSDRYLFGVLPFLFALWGMGFAATFAWLREGVLALADQVLSALPVRLPERPARLGLITISLAFLFAASGEPMQTARALISGHLPHAPGRNVISPDWPQARPLLAPWLERAEVVVTTDELSALYFLGRADLVISGTRLSEVGDHSDFSRDPRTGVPVIKSADALREVIACRQNGLIVIPRFDLDAEWTVSKETREALVGLTDSVALPGLDELRVFRWRTPAAALRPCPAPVGAAPHG